MCKKSILKGKVEIPFFKKILVYVPWVLTIISIFLSLMIIFPSCFYRWPLISHVFEEKSFPIKYEFSGYVKIVDGENNILNDDVEIFVGGYSTKILSSTDFNMSFYASVTDTFFVTIRYRIGQEIYEYTECVSVPYKERIIKEEFIINA